MPAYVALLRAVNVGGNTLPMPVLAQMCRAAGFERPRTYIASGNALFVSPLREQRVREALVRELTEYFGKPIGVQVRTAAQLTAVVAANPFPETPPNRTVAIFLQAPPPVGAIEEVRGRKCERLACGAREIYVHYPDGIGASRLVIPAATAGTARNLNTVGALAALAAQH
ncbi:MAG: DUF1697 domain-containing protein [Steroidobacteraceae bacterium]